jgi:hypothetical protein
MEVTASAKPSGPMGVFRGRAEITKKNYKKTHSCKAYRSFEQGGLLGDESLPQAIQDRYSSLRRGTGAFIISSHTAAPSCTSVRPSQSVAVT